MDYALVLVPQASKTLIRLGILSTYNAQGPYLLRAVVPDGELLALRSLIIHLYSWNSPKPQGSRWREDEKGVVSQADAKRPTRQFDSNYIMSLSKAAPNVEELELMGTSDDTIVSSLVVHRCLFKGRDGLKLERRIPSPLPYPVSKSYSVSLFLVVSITITQPSLHGRLTGPSTPISALAVSPRRILGSMLLRILIGLHKI